MGKAREESLIPVENRKFKIYLKNKTTKFLEAVHFTVAAVTLLYYKLPLKNIS